MSCKHGEWPPCDLCDEVDAAFKSGYEEGGKLSIDLTMKHLQRAEKAEQANRRMVELLKRLVEWSEKYPSSRIYNESEIRAIAKQIDGISAMSAELLKGVGE